MPLDELIIGLVLAGAALWAVNTYVSTDVRTKNILNAVILIAVVIWLLHSLGLFNGYR